LVLIHARRALKLMWLHRLEEELNAAGRVTPRALLLPEILDLPPKMASAMEDSTEKLSRLGLATDVVGPGRVALRSVPEVLATAEPKVLWEAAQEALERGDTGADSSTEFGIRRERSHKGTMRLFERMTEYLLDKDTDHRLTPTDPAQATEFFARLDALTPLKEEADTIRQVLSPHALEKLIGARA
jgi:DNA mismatch repair protein MutL